MANMNQKSISPEKFEFVNMNTRLTDVKFDDKPIGYFKDAWIRFRKSKAAVVATGIIILIFLFSLTAPLFTRNEATFMDTYYAKKGPYINGLREIGIADGSVRRDFSEMGLIAKIAIGMGAEDWEGTGKVTLEQGMESEYQPIRKVSDPFIQMDAAKREKKYYHGRIDAYAEVGFIYKSIEQPELQRMLDWEKETGLHLLYPLIEDNEWNPEPKNANYWFKCKKYQPVFVSEEGKTKNIAYSIGQRRVLGQLNFRFLTGRRILSLFKDTGNNIFFRLLFRFGDGFRFLIIQLEFNFGLDFRRDRGEFFLGKRVERLRVGNFRVFRNFRERFLQERGLVFLLRFFLLEGFPLIFDAVGSRVVVGSDPFLRNHLRLLFAFFRFRRAALCLHGFRLPRKHGQRHRKDKHEDKQTFCMFPGHVSSDSFRTLVY